MSDISNQLIKDSYNYVLQSDISTGIVYRIGGGVPVNPSFLSGLTIYSGFTYSNGTEQPNYVLTTDGTGYSFWAPSQGSSSGNFLPLSGGTVTGSTNFTSGLTANTISATTYLNLPTDVFVTGATKSGSVATFRNNTGGTFTLTGLTDTFVTGATKSGSVATFRNNTGGTFTLTGLTDTFVTGGTYSNGTATFTNNTGGTFNVVGLTTPFTGGTVSGVTNFTNTVTANVISATTYLNLPPESPTYIKIASMSGRFVSNSLISPNITRMYVGNSSLGWSFGDYDFIPTIDGFGNLISINHVYSNVGIPLPTDILRGDKIKICGLCYYSEGVRPEPLPQETFYITVSYFTCENYLSGGDIFVSTLIPVSPYTFNESASICFSEEITNNFTLPGCTTYLVVGMTVGNDMDTNYEYKFSYTLDVTQTVFAGSNLLIRNCCDPAYSEIIQNNGVTVGKSFIDIDGNCWSIVSETTSDITGSRILDTEYDDCEICINTNGCPENFVVRSCCGAEGQIFTAALVGVEVGSTFVDDWGFCWEVIDSTPSPITNVVTVSVVYTESNCESEVCTNINTCPNLLRIDSCCKNLGFGFTTSDILGISLVVGDVFVDTFGLCWEVTSENNVGFPNLNFLVGATIYNSCENCISDNDCEVNLFYTIQNCCNEEIEVIELPPSYGVGYTLGLVHDNGIGCYKILSWSNIGTSTLQNVKVENVSPDNPEGCIDCIRGYLNDTCIGQIQCCTQYTSTSFGCSITGYLCDGTWVVEQLVPLDTSVCMAFVSSTVGNFNTRCCTFSVYNPSSIQGLDVSMESCDGTIIRTVIEPLSTYSCVKCVLRVDGPWEWVECI